MVTLTVYKDLSGAITLTEIEIPKIDIAPPQTK